VTRVLDGDTIEVKLDGGHVQKVRLIGVDTPESVHPRRPLEPYAVEASTFLTNLLRGEDVYLIDQEEAAALDFYGRRLAYVYRCPDGMFVNLEIVRQGYGRAYLEYPFAYEDLFTYYENRAAHASKGLWAISAHSHETEQSIGQEPVVGAEAAAGSSNGGGIVYVTATGTKYHTLDCPHLRESKTALSREEARQRGYEPCGTCGGEDPEGRD
jgi:micrococcal nuclease